MDQEKTPPKRPVIGNISKSNVKSMFGWLFTILAFGLIVLPFISSFNDALTNLAIHIKGYKVVSQIIVPQEVRSVVVLLRLVGVDAKAAGEYVLIEKVKQPLLVEIIWNCVGWQSLVTFLLTIFIGFQSKFTVFSKLSALIFGIVGTLLVNVIRITIIIWLFSNANLTVATIVHDYGALLSNTAWLFGFWWISYEFILERVVYTEHASTLQ